MSPVVPASFLFQYSLAIPYIGQLPGKKKGSGLHLPDSAKVFVPGLLDRPQGTFHLKMGWNEKGLAIEIKVQGKKMPVLGRSDSLQTSDYVQLMIDTRHTASVHRATAWCSSLVVLPVDESSGRKPKAMIRDIAQQRDVRSSQDASECQLFCDAGKDGYQLEVWIPSALLFGFQEAPEIGRIGFYCVVHDSELGELPLSVGGDFPVTFDPATWLSLELTR